MNYLQQIVNKTKKETLAQLTKYKRIKFKFEFAKVLASQVVVLVICFCIGI